MDHFYDYQKLVSVSYYDNNPNRWLYADFQMVYDPCTCFYQSELNIDVDLIEKAQVDITGKIEGKLFDILSNNQGSGIEEDRGKKSFGIDDVGSVSKKAYQTFKSINSFSSDVQKSLDGTKRQEAEDISGEDLSNLNESELDDYIYDYIQLENTNYTDMLKMKNRISEQKTSVDKLAGKLAEWDFLRDALKAAPFIGSAVTVLDYFVGGGQKKNAQTVRLSPTGIDAVINLDGTIKIDAPYDNIKINTPGCDNSNLIYANTPIYDQVLGTFNLLKTPVIEYYNKRRLDVWTEPPVLVQDDLRYMLHNDIEYVANPAAGFNMEEIEILASFIFEFDHQFIGYQPLTENLDNLIIQEDLSTFRTQYVPLECLSEVRAMFVSDYYYYMGNDYAPFYFQTPVPDVYLKLLVNFTRNDVDNNTQNVLFVGRYPVETYIITEHAGWDEKWQSDYLNIPNDVVLENETISESISAWNTITIGENVTFNPNGNLIVEAGKQIILNGEYSIVDNLPANSSVIFELGVKAGCTNPRINPVTGQNLADFCSSNIEGNYKPDSRYFSFINNDSPKYNRIIIYPIYPNPVSSRLFVRYYLPADSYIQMKIINKLGLSVGDYLSDEYQLSGENQLEYDVSGLTSGIYYLVITHENQKITKQFVVIK